MGAACASKLDQHVRLRLADLPAKQFEDFFLHFLNAGVSLTVERGGRRLTKKVIYAETYAAGTGQDQKGIDLRVVVEGPEEWCFQCKRRKRWTASETRSAIKEARRYPAKHYFLVVACDPSAKVHDELKRHPQWTLWNLDRICEEFRLQVPTTKQPKCLFFLDPGEIKRFAPGSTGALISPEDFFSPFLGGNRLFRHDWKLVGQTEAMRSLETFVQGTEQKVLLLVSKGGDGKSKLLWEFTRDIERRLLGAQALFLNPHSRDDPTSAFLSDATTLVIVIDDAHRTEHVPTGLLSLVAQHAQAKLILATRPQAIPALAAKLLQVGLEDRRVTVTLKKLNKQERETLAAEALGEPLAEHASALATLTADCPFLTVVAGGLFAQGRLRWGQWASNADFQQRVFRVFEETNLRDLPSADRGVARSLLRLLAVLAPFPARPELIPKVAACLESTVQAIETQLQRLRAAELVVGRDEGLRIVPDLFADVLVYDTCYAPYSRFPAFTERVLRSFPEFAPGALRNLAEASWRAKANGVGDEQLIEGLVRGEMERFEASSFSERAGMLEYWSTFSVFIPREALRLARKAIDLETAPSKRTTHPLGELFELPETHAAVLGAITALLKPVAMMHDRYRDETLDVLWDLSTRIDWQILGGGPGRPLNAIADGIAFNPGKSLTVSESVLHWLARRVELPDSLPMLESRIQILRTLLTPCFARFVKFHEAEGRTLRWWTRPVHLENTQQVRHLAFEIVRRVIETGSWLATLRALDALEVPFRRYHPTASEHIDNPEAFRATWRPVRQRALELYERVLASYDRTLLRFEIRRRLREDLTFEEDSAFASDCRRVLASIPEDLRLRVAIAALSNGVLEFDGKTASSEERIAKAVEYWERRLAGITVGLAQECPNAEALLRFLAELSAELRSGGADPTFNFVFATLVNVNGELAAELARLLIEDPVGKPLACELSALLEGNGTVSNSERMALIGKAARSGCPGATVSAVRYLVRRAETSASGLTTEETGILVTASSSTDPEVGACFLTFCARPGRASLQLVCEILGRLPLADFPPHVVAEIWEVLVPYRPRSSPLPDATLAHLREQLVLLSELELGGHGQQFYDLTRSAARFVYELLRDRLLLAESGNAPKGYVAHLERYGFTLTLPGLRQEMDYATICDELWRRVLARGKPNWVHWRELWQAVVMEDDQAFTSRLRLEVERAGSEEEFGLLAELLRFGGSLVVFRFPEITRSFLLRAENLGGDRLRRDVQSELYSVSGPQCRRYEEGILEGAQDYVEAEALKAAEMYKSDPFLGPFYRWIVRMEQNERVWHQAQAEADAAETD